MRIAVKYLTDIEPLVKNGDWIDLRCAEEIFLRHGEYKAIPLGVAIQLPNDFEAHIVPRSSTFKNYGIIQTNSMGIIDNAYCGDNDQWHMPVYATRDIHIHKNDRICQFRIASCMSKYATIEEVEHLGNPDRGGFGSTGVK